MMKRSRLALVILFGLMMSAMLTMPVHAEVTQNDVKIPFDMYVYNPGAAEWVHLTGYLHILMIDYDGYTYRVFQSNLQGVSGIGETSGDKYQATQGGTTVVNAPRVPYPPFEMTTTFNSRLIGPGTGNNYLMHSVFHITVNANGELTAVVVESWIEVK